MSDVVPGDHLCVRFDGRADLATGSIAFLSDGMARGEQVRFFGWGSEVALRATFDGRPGMAPLEGPSGLRIGSLDDHFPRDRPPAPAELLGFWADATQAALADGYLGLRAVADTSPWSSLRHEQRLQFLQGEQLINRYRRQGTFTLLCASDGAALDDEALEETASIHPRTSGVPTPFRLHASGQATLVLGGEVDGLSAPLLSRVLETTAPHQAGGDLLIDASGVGFINHNGLLAIARHADRWSLRDVVLRDPPPAAGRLIELLGLRRLHVVWGR